MVSPFEADEPHTLCGPTRSPDLIDRDPDDHSSGRHENHFIFLAHRQDAHRLAILGGTLDIDDSFSSAGLETVILKKTLLPKSEARYGENLGACVENFHRDDFILLSLKSNPVDPSRAPAHLTDLLFRKTDRLAAFGGKENLILSAC